MGFRTLRRAALPALLTFAIALAAAAPALGFEWVAQFGVGYPGSGNGQIKTTYGTAVAPDGTVVVSDIGNQRVSVFDRSGRFLRAFGKDVSVGGGEGAEVCTNDCKEGTSGSGSGELSAPWGVAAGADEIYVADQGNHRVSVFNYQGQFLRAFGADVGGPGANVCTSGCNAGTPGAGGGQMATPSGMALAADGRLYVTEGTHRIDVFDSGSGQFQFAFGKDVGGAGVHTCTTTCQPGTADNSPGSINAAYGLSVAPDGDLFVAEGGANRVSVFSAGGQYQRSFGSEGEGAGELSAPLGAVVDGGGNAFVAESGNNRLSVFGPGGGFLRAYGFDVVPGAPVVAEVCTSECQFGAPGFGIGEFESPSSMAVDCRDSVYVGMAGRVDKWGEPGAGSPPCPPPPAAAAKPSNDFRFGKLRRNKKKGIVTVEVVVPGPGSLLAKAGRKVKAVAPQPAAEQTLRVKVQAIRGGLKILNRKGSLKATLRITFTPAGGDPNTKSRKVALRKALKKKRPGRRAAKGRPTGR